MASSSQHTGLKRMLLLAGGVLMILVGVALTVLPGPGLLLIFGGTAMLGQVIPAVRRLELRLKRKAWQLLKPGKNPKR